MKPKMAKRENFCELVKIISRLLKRIAKKKGLRILCEPSLFY